MVVDATTLADAKQEADDIWARKIEAEKAVKQTAEAILVEQLTAHWHVARKKCEAMEVLLKAEAEMEKKDA